MKINKVKVLNTLTGKPVFDDNNELTEINKLTAHLMQPGNKAASTAGKLTNSQGNILGIQEGNSKDVSFPH
jgi:hypothetical protein